MTVSGLTITGADASNYALAQPQTSADITVRTLNVTATGGTKVYDGNLTAPVTYFDNRVVGDVLTVTVTGTATFANKNVGTAKPVGVTDIAISGIDSTNYVLGNTTTSTTADITVRPITVTAVTDSKGFDGTTASAKRPDDHHGQLSRPATTATWTQTFDSTNVGTGKVLTPAGTVVDGNGGANYQVSFVTAIGTITQLAVTVTADAQTKVYGSGDPVLTYTHSALAPGDSFSGALARAETGSNVGAHAITQGTLSLPANYTITFVGANLTITARPITVTAATDSRVYNGTTASAGIPTITSGSLATGDTVTWTQTFDTAAVGTGKTLTAAGTVTDGNGGLNYNVTRVANTTGVITAKNLTVSGITAAGKTYDGTTDATLDTSAAALVGVVTGDTVTLDASGATGAFVDPNAGTGKTVTVSGLTIGGASVSNYTLTQPNTTADITKLAASITATAATKVHGQADPVLGGTYTGFLETDVIVDSYSRTPGETVAGSPYTITPSLVGTDPAVLANYSITLNNAAFTITKSNASVTPNAASKTFGAADPTLTGTLSGFLPADGVTATYTRTAGEAVGTYTISATLHAASGDLDDYNITYNTATFTINAGALDHMTISPVSSTINPGESKTYSLTGFDAAGNSLGDVTASATFTISSGGSCTGAVCTSTLVGDHTVTGSIGSVHAAAMLHVAGVLGVVSNGTYHTVTPVRVLDSRLNLGGTLFHSRTKQTINMITAASGIPSNAVAITGNVTIVSQTRNGYVTVAPMLTSGTEPKTSTINFPLGDIRANGITVPLAQAGTLDVMYWSAKTTDTVQVVIDVTGYFTDDVTGATYHSVTPVRALDSRTPLGGTLFHSRTKQTITIANTLTGVPADAIAVTGNLTVVGQTAKGYVTIAPSLTSGSEPKTSTLNFPVSDIRANGVTVPLAAGAFDVMYWSAKSSDTVNIAFDVTGYFTNDMTGATYHTLTPIRVLDSRTPLGATLFHSHAKQTFAVSTTASGVPAAAVAVTGNVTIVSQTRNGYVTVAPALTSGTEPKTSTINFPMGDIRANGVTVPIASGGLDAMYWSAKTTDTVNVIFDVTGYFS